MHLRPFLNEVISVIRRLPYFPIVLAGFLVVTISLEAQEANPKLQKDLLVKDIRQLMEVLENSHPDPYLRGGGKVEFHKRFQRAMVSVPDEGMTVKEFYRLLAPLVAGVGDGHTYLLFPQGTAEKPGLPFGFGIVENYVYIEKVYDEGHRPLLGARIDSVARIPFSALIERMKQLSGWDNEYQVLTQTCRYLNSQFGLELLLPEWKPGEPVDVEVILPAGDRKKLLVRIPDKIEAAPIEASTKIILPSVETIDFNYSFLDPDKRTALLRIDGMFSYRENFEFFRSMGVQWVVLQAAQVYKKVNDRNAPNDFDKTIAGIPSATDVFRKLVTEMKDAGTKRLIVDVRKNSGGNSMMSYILGYFLYGREALLKFSSVPSVKKYSDLYFHTYASDSLDRINEGRRIFLMKTDYDFKDDPSFEGRIESRAEREREAESYLQKAPSFWSEYVSQTHDGYYRPEEVIVVCSPWTYSSGYNLMSLFYKLGAKIVGVPSGQAGNCFGDTLVFQLQGSGLRGMVSHKQFLDFPDDPVLGRMLRPHLELTFQKLLEWNFDPNASILLALEDINR